MASGAAQTDSGVRIVFPNFSRFTRRPLVMVARWLGHGIPERGDSAGSEPARTRPSTHIGPRVPSAADLHGPMLQSAGAPSGWRDHGLFHGAGGAPCAVDAYMGYFERFIAEQQLADVFMFDLGQEKQLWRIRRGRPDASFVGGDTRRGHSRGD